MAWSDDLRADSDVVLPTDVTAFIFLEVQNFIEIISYSVETDKMK